MDIQRAKAVSEVCGKLIDSARVEVEFLKVHTSISDPAKRARSKFLESNPTLTAIPHAAKAL